MSANPQNRKFVNAKVGHMSMCDHKRCRCKKLKDTHLMMMQSIGERYVVQFPGKCYAFLNVRFAAVSIANFNAKEEKDLILLSPSHWKLLNESDVPAHIVESYMKKSWALKDHHTMIVPNKRFSSYIDEAAIVKAEPDEDFLLKLQKRAQQMYKDAKKLRKNGRKAAEEKQESNSDDMKKRESPKEKENDPSPISGRSDNKSSNGEPESESEAENEKTVVSPQKEADHGVKVTLIVGGNESTDDSSSSESIQGAKIGSVESLFESDGSNTDTETEENTPDQTAGKVNITQTFINNDAMENEITDDAPDVASSQQGCNIPDCAPTQLVESESNEKESMGTKNYPCNEEEKSSKDVVTFSLPSDFERLIDDTNPVPAAAGDITPTQVLSPFDESTNSEMVTEQDLIPTESKSADEEWADGVFAMDFVTDNTANDANDVRTESALGLLLLSEGDVSEKKNAKPDLSTQKRGRDSNGIDESFEDKRQKAEKD